MIMNTWYTSGRKFGSGPGCCCVISYSAQDVWSGHGFN
jgi:hypothetical protein